MLLGGHLVGSLLKDAAANVVYPLFRAINLRGHLVGPRPTTMANQISHLPGRILSVGQSKVNRFAPVELLGLKGGSGDTGKTMI